MQQNEEMKDEQRMVDDEQYDLQVLMEQDIVEDFARQLDEVVHIEDNDSMIETEDMHSTTEYEYYQPLPQNEGDADNNEQSAAFQQLPSDDEDEVLMEPANLETVSNDEMPVNDNQLLNHPPSLELDETNRLNPETSDLIKSIMTNIQLSDNAVPDWAKKIPEHAWLPRVKN